MSTSTQLLVERNRAVDREIQAEKASDVHYTWCMPSALRSRFATLIIAALALSLPAAIAPAQTMHAGRPAAILKGEQAQVVVDLAGGSIVNFQLNDQGLNPLVWANTGPEDEARPMSHFICLDRWGAPSAAELKQGMVFHGEATRMQWKLLKEPKKEGDSIVSEMSASLPMAGLEVKRTIELAAKGSWFKVTEEVTNRNQLGRIFNFVQHPSIGPPFLDETVVVDSNARRGLMQSSPMPNPEEPAVVWPQALKDGQPVNLRHLRDDPLPNVVSFTIDEEFGWVTAANPARGLLIGYLWRVFEYPWLNIWRHVQDGKPLARGLEFGTTGLHQPFGVLVKKGRIFGRPIYAHLDTGETVSKSYVAFLIRIPNNYQGVGRVAYNNGALVVTERDTTEARSLTLNVGALFPN
jgi:hypothetical protein